MANDLSQMVLLSSMFCKLLELFHVISSLCYVDTSSVNKQSSYLILQYPRCRVG